MCDYNHMSTKALKRLMYQKERRQDWLAFKEKHNPLYTEEKNRLFEQIKLIKAVVRGREETLPLWDDK